MYWQSDEHSTARGRSEVTCNCICISDNAAAQYIHCVLYMQGNQPVYTVCVFRYRHDYRSIRELKSTARGLSKVAPNQHFLGPVQVRSLEQVLKCKLEGYSDSRYYIRHEFLRNGHRLNTRKLRSLLHPNYETDLPHALEGFGPMHLQMGSLVAQHILYNAMDITARAIPSYITRAKGSYEVSKAVQQ